MILLGGASRTGKTILTKELIRRTGLPCLSTDPIKMSLARAVPDYPLDTNGSSLDVCEQLWPFISTLIRNQIETNAQGIIEGEILPKHAAQIMTEQPDQVRACFIGYRSVSIVEKRQQIRENEGHSNDWTADLSDQELNRLIEDSIGFSHHLESECTRLNLPYIDFSDSFEQSAERVIRLLTE